MHCFFIISVLVAGNYILISFERFDGNVKLNPGREKLVYRVSESIVHPQFMYVDNQHDFYAMYQNSPIY